VGREYFMLLEFLSLRHYHYSSSLSATTSMLVAAAPSLLSPPSLPPSLVANFVFFISYFAKLSHLLGNPVDKPMESVPALLASRSLRSPTCCKALAVCSLMIFLEMTKKSALTMLSTCSSWWLATFLTLPLGCGGWQ
jgi:hypothetical protein